MTLRNLRWVVGVLVAGMVGLMPSRGVSGERPALRVGVARADVTPTAPVMLAGYGSRKDLSTGVHDPLSARAVVFERDETRLVLVSTDLIGFYGGSLETIRLAILEACGLRPDELFLTAIHTHSGPSLGVGLDGGKAHPNNVAYTRTLGGKLAALVKNAQAHATPARVATGSGSSPVGVNRREVVKDRTGALRVVLGRNPAGPTDPEVQVVVVKPAGATTPSAVLFAYATHSTSLGPANLRISGDVHGLAARFVEAHLGGRVVAPEFAGASGDIDPWFRVLPRFKTEGGWLPEPELLGAWLGEEVVTVARRVEAGADAGPVRVAGKTLELPAKSGDDDGPATSPTRPFHVSVGRVGDVAFVGLGGEVFNQIGRAIKAGSPFAATVVMTHCNGAAGYLPTRDSYPAGGYEVQSSGFGPDAADLLVKEVLALLATLR
jgi:neutral ceramidase